jgi:uncharacterized protein involved in cysteine biosynthesis
LKKLANGWTRIGPTKIEVPVENSSKNISVVNILAVIATTIISVAVALSLAYFSIDFLRTYVSDLSEIVNVLIWTFYYMTILRFFVLYIIKKRNKSKEV